MTSLNLCLESIPSLKGKTALITGGSSGIGLSTTQLLTSRDCRTYILDLYPPTVPLSPHAIFLKCDITRWSDLVHAFTNAANDPENTSSVGVESYTEVEETIAELRPKWMGEENATLTRKQQAATDFRGM